MSKPFDWLISTAQNPALRFIRAVFRSRPHVVSAEDVNRQFEALTENSHEVQRRLGVIGKNLFLEFSGESFTDNGGGSFSISTTATFKRVFAGQESYIYANGCRFPVNNNEAFPIGNATFNKTTEGYFLWLIAKKELIDFVGDGELSGVTTTNNSIVAGADTMVYSSYRFAYSRDKANISLNFSEEVICAVAGIRWTDEGPEFYQTFLSPEKAFIDSTLELEGEDVSNDDSLGLVNIMRRMFDKLKQASLITRDIIVTVPWSDFEIGDVINEGTFLTDLIAQAVEVAYAPETLLPSVSVVVSPSPELAEVGSELITNVYGVFIQRQAGALVSSELFYRNGSISASASSTNFPAVISNGNNAFRYRATFAQGPMPADLLGNEYPDDRIEAGSLDSPEVIIKGVYPILYGVSATPGLTGVDIYSDGAKILQETTDIVEIPWPTSQKGVYLWFAIKIEDPIKQTWRNKNQPAGIGRIGNVNSLFKPATSKAVTSSGLVSNWTKTYRLYVTALPTEGDTLIIE